VGTSPNPTLWVNKLSICLVTYYARHLSLAFMKRWSGASTQMTRLISQQSPADPTLFKLENPDSDPEPVPPASAARRSKRVKLEVAEAGRWLTGMGVMKNCPH